jgi:hypothetical protein
MRHPIRGGHRHSLIRPDNSNERDARAAIIIRMPWIGRKYESN